MFETPDLIYTGKSCFQCKHFKVNYESEEEIIHDYANCVAFPEGIPDEVWVNGHYEPRPDLGQENEVVFDPNPIEVKFYAAHFTESRKACAG